MLGARTAGELSRGGRPAGEPLTGAGLTGVGPAIKDRLAALESGAGGWSGWRNEGCLVDRPRPGLRHHHAASRRGGCSGLGARLRSGRRLRSDGWHRGRRFSHGRRRFGSARSGCRRLGDGRWRHRLGGRRSCCGSGRLNGDLLFACWCDDGRLDHGRGWGRDNDNRACRDSCACGRLGHNRASRRTARDGRSGWRRRNDGRRLTRLRDDLARLGAGRGSGHRLGCNGSRDRGGNRLGDNGNGGLGRGNGRRLNRQAGMARIFLVLLLLGQNGLEDVAGLLDVGEIDLGNDLIRGVTRGGGGRMRSRALSLREVRANLGCLVRLQRAGVRFGSSNTELRKNVENRARLDFKLFREIVDTNLAHPPLFNPCRQKAA